jgi:hypothetical protein
MCSLRFQLPENTTEGDNWTMRQLLWHRFGAAGYDAVTILRGPHCGVQS